MRLQLIFLAVCLTFENTAFAQQNSDGGWKVGWTWDGGRSRSNVKGLTDEDMVAMLYSRSSGLPVDHPSLYERMEFRKAYEVTENPSENDYQDDNPGTYQQETFLGASPDHLEDNSLGSVDNTLTVGQRPYSSSSSTFMSSSTGDVHRTEYSHQIIHSRKKRSEYVKRLLSSRKY